MVSEWVFSCLPQYCRDVCCLTLQNAVNNERNSGNFDYPEGGFDGLIQAIVCTDVSGSSSDACSYFKLTRYSLHKSTPNTWPCCL